MRIQWLSRDEIYLRYGRTFNPVADTSAPDSAIVSEKLGVRKLLVTALESHGTQGSRYGLNDFSCSEYAGIETGSRTLLVEIISERFLWSRYAASAVSVLNKLEWAYRFDFTLDLDPQPWLFWLLLEAKGCTGHCQDATYRAFLEEQLRAY